MSLQLFVTEASLPILIAGSRADLRDEFMPFLVNRRRSAIGIDTVEGARAILARQQVSLTVLDLDPFAASAFATLRAAARTPMIALSMHDGEERVIKALSAGADDYIVRPFSHRELLARIDAVVRRAFELPPALKFGARVCFGNWTLHRSTRELVGRDGQRRSLSSRECQLLLALLARPRVLLSRCQLLDIAFPQGPRLSARAVDTVMSRIRRKLRESSDESDMIKTAWGAGYLFRGDVEELDWEAPLMRGPNQRTGAPATSPPTS